MAGQRHVGWPVWLAYGWATLMIGFKSRRYWGVVAYFGIGAFSAVTLPLALLVVVGVLASTAGRWPADIYLTWFFAPPLLMMALFWPLLIRALRLRYMAAVDGA